MKTKAQKTLTQKEIGAALNNGYAAASNSTATIKQGEERKRALRNYTFELVSLLWPDVVSGDLKAEEMVEVFAGAALFVQCARVMKTTKLPMMEDLMKRHLEDLGEEE